MWFANFFVAASATMILPFLSLYIETFGDFSSDYVQRWAGFVFGITFLTAFFVSPLWGRFGDKYGYKKILMITGFGIAISIFLMGYVSSVSQLFFLRLFMGVVTGFIPTSLALISAQTPKESAGKVLGTLQMGTVSGGLLGPLIGGAFADSVGFQYTFFLTSIVITLATLLVTFGIKEIRKQETEETKKFTRKQVLAHIFHHPVLLSIMMISVIIQAANFSVQPLLALYVSELTEAVNLAFLAGLAFSATGFGNMLATRQWGKLGDKIGHEKVIFILLILAGIMFIPQAFASSLLQLVIFRFIFGIAIGGLIPCMTAYIRQVAPLSVQGEVLGYNVSFRYLGNVIGPTMGGILSGFFGISTVFLITSCLFFLSAVILWLSIHRSSEEVDIGMDVQKG
ncbi:MFS transporter [Litchfieldia salsa]|uniref:Predicted arabinose efflux permease, MFS family n=1 Tax=Litchfieldia salsa TaxID=930152 RepID=A0A1H0WYC6_9BACI|nr:MFS transporter [Litchfieldia salsa]SDP95687.1 Predicted arabinose efflux permease, MFS family [Litchfieldia salsa]